MFLRIIKIYSFIAFFISYPFRPPMAQELPTLTSTLFSGSGNCATCHSAGTGVLTTSTGEDISPASLWRSTMMANASKDPLWQAKVSAEVSESPSLQAIIEDKCTTCHAPMGRTEAIYTGSTNFSMQSALADPLSLDGVSCTLCHQIQNTNLGQNESFSGGFEIKNGKEIFGPYPAPTAAPMFNMSGYNPLYSDHVRQSELCATCHTLYTPYLDDQGQIAGKFPEQVPYLEWLNSRYPSQGTECQTCHMPAVNEAMLISLRPPWLSTLQQPIWKHDLVGANVWMIQMLNQHRTELGITAETNHLEATLAKTELLLQEKTIELACDGEIIADTMIINVRVQNLAGHKFPTGFPSRRAWLHVIVTDSNDEVFFESGKWDNTGKIIGLDPNFEPHHQEITQTTQTQIYQAVMADVNDQVTFTLLRGASYKKDNRLPPKGFTTQAANYNDMAIMGDAAQDPDFNRDDAGEGTGSDQVRYKVAIAGRGNDFFVQATMVYQTLAWPFAEHLLSLATEPITRFRNFYESADRTPIPIQSVSFTVKPTSVGQRELYTPANFNLLRSFPNPFNQSTVIALNLAEAGPIRLDIYNLLGRRVRILAQGRFQAGNYRFCWDGTDAQGESLSSGVFLVVLNTDRQNLSNRLLLLK